MGGYICDDDGPGGIPSQDQKTDWGNGGEEGQQRGMGVGLGIHATGSVRDLANKGLCEETAGTNCVVCCRETNI